mmetsp:Transcript_43321/g.50147  ORF Transcript_43321/g.50147 Transcript_43321/m.50147 type:complete len:276 (-) Transcript_43321:73-900(-)
MDRRFSANQSEDPEKKELDLSNSDLKALVLSSGLKVKSYHELMETKKEKQKQYKENVGKLVESQERKWMASHGRKHLISFDDKERAKLKQYFNSLDDDGSGSIGIEELEGPLISLGIASTRDEVQKIIDSVDEDGSGQIEFNEFLHIISSKNNDSSDGDQGIVDFFKDMIVGKLAGGQISNKLPFQLIISTVRRKKLMDALMSADDKKKTEGEKVLTNYAKLLAMRKRGLDKDDDKSEYDENDEEEDNKSKSSTAKKGRKPSLSNSVASSKVSRR